VAEAFRQFLVERGQAEIDRLIEGRNVVRRLRKAVR
jgi:hypothetical protein